LKRPQINENLFFRFLFMKQLVQTVIFLVVVFGCGLTVSFAQTQNKCEPPNVFDYDDDHTLTVQASELLKMPKCYDGKFVRTIGFYRYGFEVSNLFCLECEGSNAAWVDTSNFYAAVKRCTSPENLKKLESKNGKTLGVVVLGILRTRLTFENQSNPKDKDSKRMSELVSGGGFGHMNAYDSEFSPICFEQVEDFGNNYLLPSGADEKTLKRMKSWYDKAYDKL
jgi:hypothetical protein